MRALYVGTVGFSLSRPSFTSRFSYQRFRSFSRNSTSISRTHHQNLSRDEALLLQLLSDGDLRDAHHLLDRIPQRECCGRVVHWTSLLTKYARVGFVDEARALFEVIPERNIVTYNAMLSGYVRCGRLDDAWTLFREMSKNVVSWTVMLCGLCEAGMVDDAVDLFDEMPERNVVSWNSLVAGLIRNGDLERARRVFDAMPSRNIISWNAMISGYTENCKMEEARMLFQKMGERNVVTWTTMVAGYCRAGDVLEGYRLFGKMPERNIVSWTAMIGGFAWNEFHKEALLLFLEMKKDPYVKPNGETFLSLAYACAGVGFHRLGKQLHTQIIANGWDHVDHDRRLSKSLVHMYASFGLIGSARSLFDRNLSNCDLQSCNYMISGYLRTGCLKEAQNLFEKVQNLRDKVSWTSMIDGYLNAGEVSKASDLFREISDKDGITWTVMISGLVKNELFAEAASLFSEMLARGLQPLNSVYSVLFGAAGATANLDQGKQLHCMGTKTGYESDLILENSLISMYAKCGAIDDAYRVFTNMVYRDLVSWNSMIMGFSHHGQADKALELFKQMLNSGMNPNSITFLAVLSACSHSGLITQGFELFNQMKNTNSIQPATEHFISMINLLGRAGKLQEAEEFLSTLPFTPDHTIYGALLGVCRINGRDTGMAERAAERLLELDPLNAPAHVALCNVYASNGKRAEEHGLRKEMGMKGVKKMPGCSWVVVNGRAHVFLSGDELSSQVAQLILPLLCGLPVEQKQRNHFPYRFLLIDIRYESDDDNVDV